MDKFLAALHAFYWNEDVRKIGAFLFAIAIMTALYFGDHKPDERFWYTWLAYVAVNFGTWNLKSYGNPLKKWQTTPSPGSMEILSKEEKSDLTKDRKENGIDDK